MAVGLGGLVHLASPAIDLAAHVLHIVNVLTADQLLAILWIPAILPLITVSGRTSPLLARFLPAKGRLPLD